jgi:hypothetical protein
MPKGRHAKAKKRVMKTGVYVATQKIRKAEKGQLHQTNPQRRETITLEVFNSMMRRGREGLHYLKESMEEVAEGMGQTLEQVREAVLFQSNIVVRWGREPIDTSAEGVAFHMWIEDEEGNIHDPHFEEYDNLMFLHNCDGSQKVYAEWSAEQQKEKLKNLLPSVMFAINNDLATKTKRTQEEKQEFIEFLSTTGMFACCPLNAMAKKRLNPTWTIKIGSLGFRSIEDPEKIFWEY